MTLDLENARLRHLLMRHEGLRLKLYRCTAGKLTIGVGRNIEDNGITQQEAMLMLSHDIARVQKEAVDNFPWFKSLNLARQDVVLSMLFQLGLRGFKGFRKMIKALRAQDYEHAAEEMQDSRWFEQTPERAKELSQMMRLGRYL